MRSAVKLNRPMGPDDPDQVSIDFATERSNAIPGQDFTPDVGNAHVRQRWPE